MSPKFYWKLRQQKKLFPFSFNYNGKFILGFANDTVYRHVFYELARMIYFYSIPSALTQKDLFLKRLFFYNLNIRIYDYKKFPFRIQSEGISDY